MRNPSWLIRGAELPGRGICDIRIAAGIVEAIAPTLTPREIEPVVEASGNALLRGLHDHHMHLLAATVARHSLVCGPPSVRDAQSLRRALREHLDWGDGWIRGVAFHESVCEPFDRHWLDGACPDRPVRVQHRSGMLWVLNTRAIEKLGLRADETLPEGVEYDASGAPSGRFFGLDDWLGARLGLAPPSLAELSAELARHGVTGVTDASARNGPDVWQLFAQARRSGELRQRLVVMGSEALEGVDGEGDGGMALGPLKVYLREVALPEWRQLVQRIVRTHDRGRNIAVHCTTRLELMYAITALEEAGVLRGDRIEHAAVTDAYALERVSELGLTVVTQPHFIAERGPQYLEQVDVEEIPLLYRLAAFLRCGVRLAAGSDAPYGNLDPWFSMRAATLRSTDEGVVIGADERLSPLEAFELWGGDPFAPGGAACALVVGDAADLCLLDVPWQLGLAKLDSSHVALTVCAGNVVYSRGGMYR